MKSITFGELIKQLRIEKKLVVKEVAAVIALDPSQLSKIERDKMTAPQRVIVKLASCLDIDYKELQIKYLSDKLCKEFKEVDFSLESLEIAVKRLAIALCMIIIKSTKQYCGTRSKENYRN